MTPNPPPQVPGGPLEGNHRLTRQSSPLSRLVQRPAVRVGRPDGRQRLPPCGVPGGGGGGGALPGGGLVGDAKGGGGGALLAAGEGVGGAGARLGLAALPPLDFGALVLERGG